jgi:hypothetical protein
VCYEADDAQGSAVVFQADPKDAEAVVLMAHVTRRSALGGMARHCQPSAPLARGVSNAAGVTLDMSHDDFIARFVHRPSENHARYAGFYFYDLMEPRADAGPRADCRFSQGACSPQRWPNHGLFDLPVLRGRGCWPVAARERASRGSQPSPVPMACRLQLLLS